MGGRLRRRKIAFRERLDEKEFGAFASGAGWWYEGREPYWRSPVFVWSSADGAFIRFSPCSALSVAFADVSADDPDRYQRAMAEAHALMYRQFGSFALADVLALLSSAEGTAWAPLLTALAASAPERHSPTIAEVMTSALFAPQQTVREAALRAFLLIEWPELARPLVAHALTEPEADLASFARTLAQRVYGEDVEAYPLHTPERAGGAEESADIPADEAGEARTPQHLSAKSHLARILGASQGRIDWAP
ncbi:hypothetical protein [Streptomyces coffeae]|uniref:HEAT repeat domain-containing protein n=1 Tax=Streptomyces coffeae TaxID=621382 RepID=A0ABS1NN28_9ACTN|nr:hypothetical protein [Streptomyces coffeae]MBL1101492.1 hypothetical protein [Streptomyces coffeae]